MNFVDTRSLAALLGVSKKADPLELSDAIGKGLAVKALDQLSDLIAPDDVSFRYRIVPKATLARRRREKGLRLTPDESERVARLARVWSFALDVWKSPDSAQRFLRQPHMLLRARVPRELAAESEIGAREVENILGGLKYGTAV